MVDFGVPGSQNRWPWLHRAAHQFDFPPPFLWFRSCSMSKLGRFLTTFAGSSLENCYISLELQTTSFEWLFQLDDEPNHKINNGCLGFQLHNKLGEHFSSFFCDITVLNLGNSELITPKRNPPTTVDWRRVDRGLAFQLFVSSPVADRCRGRYC